MPLRRWTLQGWDTFAGESYAIGHYLTEAGARRAAQRYLRKLAKDQPVSGGPDGIQDQVHLVRPDGSECAIALETPARSASGPHPPK